MIHLGDITKIHGDQIEPVDCITFGSPCQDLSMAGLRAGLEGKNSGLFTEAIRVIVEMRVATNGMYPAFAIWENVPGAFSSNGGEDFRTVLEKLAHAAQPDVSIPRPAGGGRWCKAGAIIGNGWSLAWRLLNAERWGVPQRRKRIAVVADFRGQCAAEILFERTGLSGNPDKSIPTWQSVTGFTQNCPAGHDRVVAGEAAYTLKIRSGCAGGGKGALVQTEKTGTLSTLQDQTLFQPIVFDARGNGNGKTVPTITGDHESRVTDYTAIAVDLYNGAVTGSKAAALSCKNTGTTAGPQVAERKTYSEQTFSTYTYDDEHRPDPADTKRVDKDFSAAMKKLYRMCDKKGIRHPKWIVVHEYSTYVDGVWVGKHHHHVIMQRVYGLTREMVEEAWSGRGMARCEPLHFDHGYITSLAKYIMKNVRCKRHWRQSRGLKPPKMPRPNDGKMSRTKLKDVCENRLEDRAFWERMYPGYTLHYCEPIITGNNTRHLIVRLYRKETGMQQNRRNRP